MAQPAIGFAIEQRRMEGDYRVHFRTRRRSRPLYRTAPECLNLVYMILEALADCDESRSITMPSPLAVARQHLALLAPAVEPCQGDEVRYVAHPTDWTRDMLVIFSAKPEVECRLYRQRAYQVAARIAEEVAER